MTGARKSIRSRARHLVVAGEADPRPQLDAGHCCAARSGVFTRARNRTEGCCLPPVAGSACSAQRENEGTPARDREH